MVAKSRGAHPRSAHHFLDGRRVFGISPICAYESQLITGRPTTFPTVLDDIRDRARYWGWTIGVPFAEPLASREEIGLHDLRSLV